MKKNKLIILFIIVLFTLPQPAHANMAAPRNSDVGSSITFEKNDTISVLSEVLDITVERSVANIVATYKMKNTANEGLSTSSMFLSPNINTSGVKILVNDIETAYTVESYVLNYATVVTSNDWQYAVLTDKEMASYDENQRIDAITFEMEFAPNEEVEIMVSYSYQLGGYPDYNFNAKMGRIEYYLSPASMWKDFKNLTINLNLDEDMPVISYSNLEFTKIGNRQYQYISDTLPLENLEIVIDENGWQNVISTLRSPYLTMLFIPFVPFILVVLVGIILTIWYLSKKKKNKLNDLNK